MRAWARGRPVAFIVADSLEVLRAPSRYSVCCVVSWSACRQGLALACQVDTCICVRRCVYDCDGVKLLELPRARLRSCFACARRVLARLAHVLSAGLPTASKSTPPGAVPWAESRLGGPLLLPLGNPGQLLNRRSMTMLASFAPSSLRVCHHSHPWPLRSFDTGVCAAAGCREVLSQ